MSGVSKSEGVGWKLKHQEHSYCWDTFPSAQVVYQYLKGICFITQTHTKMWT